MKKQTPLHFVTLVSAPYAAVLKQAQKTDQEYERAKKLEARDPVAGAKALKALKDKRQGEAKNPSPEYIERLQGLLAGTKLAGVFTTRAQARKAITQSKYCLAEMGYYPLLVIERNQTGFSDFWPLGPDSQPEWWKLGKEGYSPCPTPKWAERIFGFSI